GDADRVIAVASDGQLVDGDKILYSCGKYLKKKGKLRGGKIVTTVMANLGLFKKLDEFGIGYEKTQVGDKYVYQCMCQDDYVIGGEQSGHIIFRDYATTGDGLLTSLFIMNMLKDEGKTLNELTDDLVIFPQLLINVPVRDKEKAMADPEVQQQARQVEKELQGMGRVLVRASGTESLVRVMAEADSEENCRKYVNQMVELIKSKNF
ncbi:MAG: phosphoglucosamine mutase, partial [Erysipelotrichaceae bacterium]|nr:phosphoglucosamine mutase [Erysipelotrichaceae bacterium]